MLPPRMPRQKIMRSGADTCSDNNEYPPIKSDLFRKYLNSIEAGWQMLLVGREVSESRMSLVEGRVHHTVDPCADSVLGSIGKKLTTGLSNQLRNTHHARRSRSGCSSGSERSRSGCSSGSERSRSGCSRGRCMVGAVGRREILKMAGIPRLASRTTTTMSRPDLIIMRPNGEITGDIVGEKGEIAVEEGEEAQRKKREMGKKKRLVVIKPRVRRIVKEEDSVEKEPRMLNVVWASLFRRDWISEPERIISEPEWISENNRTYQSRYIQITIQDIRSDQIKRRISLVHLRQIYNLENLRLIRLKKECCPKKKIKEGRKIRKWVWL
ncbi:hypothetical protein YC2023_019499 [Brassica napus]